jgi:GH15 family glucan-1,4-alpha-glucosidase
MDAVAASRPTGDPLALRSLDVLKAGQAASGAFIASPAFPVYHYAWLRDGAFCAHALELSGDSSAAAAFHRWAQRSIECQRPRVEAAIDAVAAGATPPFDAMPPARYTLDGLLEDNGDEPWPNFQLDGYGIWLWSFAQHLDGAGLDADARDTVELVARYLRASWRLPCFSCWEEYDGGEHASTHAATIAGLRAASRLLGSEEHALEAEVVRQALLARCALDGRLKRGPADDRVDGSLLWLATPFDVLPPDDPRLRSTIQAVVDDLAGPTGGLYRYLGDTYYGGGQWLLLTSSLAWHWARVGERDRARAAQEWVRTQARDNGDLPEQVTGAAQSPDMTEPWRRRWGPVATPLLWSHAMYLIAEHALRA